ncbi:MAG: NAD(P)H-quinone oxidoreductase [Rickettsiaceae bacterium]|jgi:putative PIG3 family NAD(P)H quinone oxidoreductase|nr:NAD(P)H-quinone oxidoreductase [Rickettsiaceae bacterium]
MHYKGFIAKDKTIELCTVPMRPILEHEVLIKIKASGVNHADLLQAKGHYPPPKGGSDILGLEVAGEIAEKGLAVKRFDVGTRVMALLEGGGYAEYVIVDARLCIPLPDSLSFEEACAIPETFATVWLNLFINDRFNANKIYLVHGGGGGIGTTAIQLIKHFGGKVAVTCGTDEKCQKSMDLGADNAINYNKSNFAEVILKNYPEGIDFILDSVGANYFEANLSILRDNGTLTCIGTQSGINSNINLLNLIKKRLTIKGSILRTLEPEHKYRLIEQLEGNILPLISGRFIKPIICKKFKFIEAKEALIVFAQKEHFGKIILTHE